MRSSPDGKYVVYATIDGANQTLWVRQVATQADVWVIPPETVRYYQLQISPDGDYVYYCLSQNANTDFADILRMPLLGGERRKIVSNVDGNFSVSPDGRRIAFVRFNGTERIHRLSVANVDNGAEAEVIARTFPEFIVDLTWMPDGRRVAFVLATKARGECRLDPCGRRYPFSPRYASCRAGVGSLRSDYLSTGRQRPGGYRFRG